MKIDIKTLDRVNGLFVNKKMPVSWIKEYYEKDDPILNSFINDIDIRLNLTFTTTEQLICYGGWNTLLHFECDRCLEPFDFEFKDDFTVMMFPKGTPDFDEDSVTDCFFYEGEEIDFLSIFGELMSLNYPFLKTCKPECMGICQDCGKNRNFENCNCKDKNSGNKFETLKKLKIGG